MRHRVAEGFAERLFKSSYNQLLNGHDSDTFTADGTSTGGPTTGLLA